MAKAMIITPCDGWPPRSMTPSKISMTVAETKLIGGTKRVLTIHFDPLAACLEESVTDRTRTNNSGGQQSILFRQPHVPQPGNPCSRPALFCTAPRRSAASSSACTAADRYICMRLPEVIDGPEEPADYVLYGDTEVAGQQAAVTLSIAKRPGANAVSVVEDVLAKVDSLKGRLIPADLKISVTRDYGATASEKSNELLLHMGIAVFGVAVLILFFLGWRESIVVMLAIPSTLALTLLVFYLYGYTLNRITLFALIFSIGILVDDAIVVVENIVRHLRLPGNKGKSKTTVAIEAVAEVGNPTILATWAVIAAILPMAFVGGLMGPYMRPIPIGSSAAMLFSLIIAFTVTPWAATHILKHKALFAPITSDEDESSG